MTVYILMMYDYRRNGESTIVNVYRKQEDAIKMAKKLSRECLINRQDLRVRDFGSGSLVEFIEDDDYIGNDYRLYNVVERRVK